jgi:hypothetical protein
MNDTERPFRSVMRKGPITYVWNGSLTVNVWRDGVNFDAFMFDEKPNDIVALRTYVESHHDYAKEADYRYSTPNLTRTQLLYG